MRSFLGIGPARRVSLSGVSVGLGWLGVTAFVAAMLVGSSAEAQRRGNSDAIRGMIQSAKGQGGGQGGGQGNGGGRGQGAGNAQGGGGGRGNSGMASGGNRGGGVDRAGGNIRGGQALGGANRGGAAREGGQRGSAGSHSLPSQRHSGVVPRSNAIYGPGGPGARGGATTGAYRRHTESYTVPRSHDRIPNAANSYRRDYDHNHGSRYGYGPNHHNHPGYRSGGSGFSLYLGVPYGRYYSPYGGAYSYYGSPFNYGLGYGLYGYGPAYGPSYGYGANYVIVPSYRQPYYSGYGSQLQSGGFDSGVTTTVLDPPLDSVPPNSGLPNRARSNQDLIIPAEGGAAEFQRQAELAFREHRFDDAVRLANHAAIEDPRNGKLHLFAAQALFAVGEYQPAAAAIHLAASLLDRSEWGYVIENYKQFYRGTDFVTQMDALVQFSKENPDAAYAHFLRGYQYQYLGYDASARKLLKKAVTLEPQDRLAEALLAMLPGDPDEVTPPAEPKEKDDEPAGGTKELLPPPLELKPAAASEQPARSVLIDPLPDSLEADPFGTP